MTDTVTTAAMTAVPPAAPERDPTCGATDDPQHAVATAHGRYYHDPGRPPGDPRAVLPSVTNVLQQLGKPHLIKAAATFTAEWAAERIPEAVRAAADPDDLAEFVHRAKTAHREAWDERADLGSRAHRLAEAHNLGAPIAPDPAAEPFLEAYKRWLDDFGVNVATDIVAAECTVLHRQIGYAGTSDLWVRLRFGRATSPLVPRFKPRKVPAQPLPTPDGLWLVDLKTSLTKPASALYIDNLLQLAALLRARTALVCPPECRYGASDAHDASHEYPVPAFAGAAVLNLRRSGYGFIPVPADDEAAFTAFRGLLQATRYVHALDLRPFKPVQPPVRKEAS
ncbi:hypothetical protein ACWDA3_59185 [Nonomuraea rubra]